MKTSFLTALLVTLGASQEEKTPNALTEKEKAEGWKLLFDGASLAGWMSWKTKKPLEGGGAWAAREGALRITGKGGGDIYTAETFENFELSLEWKAEGNSGVLYRVDPEYKGQIWKVAPEIQVYKDNAKSVGAQSSGALYALYGIEGGEKVVHPDGWNLLVVRLVNGRGVHTMNGKKLCEYQIGSDDWKGRVARSKFKDEKGFAQKADGHIGLQDHGALVAFRTVKIRRLAKE